MVCATIWSWSLLWGSLPSILELEPIICRHFYGVCCTLGMYFQHVWGLTSFCIIQGCRLHDSGRNLENLHIPVTCVLHVLGGSISHLNGHSNCSALKPCICMILWSFSIARHVSLKPWVCGGFAMIKPYVVSILVQVRGSWSLSLAKQLQCYVQW